MRKLINHSSATSHSSDDSKPMAIGGSKGGVNYTRMMWLLFAPVGAVWLLVGRLQSVSEHGPMVEGEALIYCVFGALVGLVAYAINKLIRGVCREITRDKPREHPNSIHRAIDKVNREIKNMRAGMKT